MKLLFTSVAIVLSGFLWSCIDCSKAVTLSCGDDAEAEIGPSGRPGKRGPKGDKGQRGRKGDRGQSDESAEEIARLKERMLQLEREIDQKIDRAIAASRHKDCSDVSVGGSTSNGVYDIIIPNNVKKGFCDFEIEGAGWMVFQRRVDGRTDFFRTWQEYRQGFGDPENEFWFGLDGLHQITSSRSYSLRVDMEDWENNTAYAQYSTFRIGNARSNFLLTVGGYSGNAGDSLAYHNGQAFTTRDNDNDALEGSNCSSQHRGGWWYKRCHYSNLNGQYVNGGQQISRGVDWRHWKNRHYSLKRVEMKIRRN